MIHHKGAPRYGVSCLAVENDMPSSSSTPQLLQPESEDRMNATERAVKRGLDVVCSALALVVLSPVFLLISLLLRCQRGGSVFYSQERIGRGGRPFRIYKFRTMSEEAEEEGPQLMAEADDSLSTPVERFLRRRHLDELPQLWNVLKGDMSIVGYRPERQFFIDQIMQLRPDYALLYAIRPGLTSEATIFNGYTDTMDKMIRRLDMDLRYLRNRTLWLDLKICLLTLGRLFARAA